MPGASPTVITSHSLSRITFQARPGWKPSWYAALTSALNLCMNESVSPRSLCREEDCCRRIARLSGRYPPRGPLTGGITSPEYRNVPPLVAGDHPVFLVRAKSACPVVCPVFESLIPLTAFTVCSCNGQRVGGLSLILARIHRPLTTTSLDDFIDTRLGRNHGSDMHHSGLSGPDVRPQEDIRSRSARIRAFRAQQQAQKEGTPRPSRPPASLKAVHLLSAEEVKSLFHDVTAGLAFLVCEWFSVCSQF